MSTLCKTARLLPSCSRASILRYRSCVPLGTRCYSSSIRTGSFYSSLRSEDILKATPASSMRGRRYAHDQATTQTETADSEKEAIELPQSNADESRVAIGWQEGVWSRFHHLWLRDHCRCPECFHPVTKQRLVDTFALPPDPHPRQVVSKVEGLEVTWPTSPPHISLYPWDWLRRNSYDPKLTNTDRQDAFSIDDHKVLWGSKIQQHPPTVSYEDVISDDVAVLKWLEKLDRFGFCFITGVPVNVEDTEKLSRRISFIRETKYGGFWDFTADLARGDTAYTSLALPAHTDNTYFTDPCGLQLFHLLAHEGGTGGQTLLVDGFYAASILKELHPESYKILSETRIPAHAAGDPDSLYRPTPLSGYPILNHDPMNPEELLQVRYNNDDRSVMNNLEPSAVLPWYQALRHWHECLKSADSEFWVQLNPGTAVVVDNYRVLHGRSSFTGKRRMCGAYIGHDDYHSRLDSLRGKYSEQDGGSKERSVWDPLF